MLKVDKKNYPQIYVEQYKCKIRKRELVNFIDDEVNVSSNDSDDSEERLQIIINKRCIFLIIV